MDILLSDSSEGVLLQVFALIQWALKLLQYLGHQLYPKQIVAQKIQVRKDNLLTSIIFKRC